MSLGERRTETLRSPEKENHNRLLLYTGVSCSGKDYLLDRAMANLSDIELQRLSMGTFISEQLKIHRDGVRDQMNLQEIEQFKMDVVAPEVIAQQPAVLVTHIVPKYNHVITMNPDYEKALNPSHFVAVVSDPELIQAWRIARNETGYRFSPPEDLDTIALHQEMVTTNTYIIAKH